MTGQTGSNGQERMWMIGQMYLN